MHVRLYIETTAQHVLRSASRGAITYAQGGSPLQSLYADSGMSLCHAPSVFHANAIRCRRRCTYMHVTSLV